MSAKFDELPDIKCKNCGSYFFNEIYMVKRVSGLLSKSGKTEIMPYPVLVCTNPDCNTILEDLDNVDAKEEPKSKIILP